MDFPHTLQEVATAAGTATGLAHSGTAVRVASLFVSRSSFASHRSSPAASGAFGVTLVL